MFQALYLKVHVEVGPLDGVAAAEADVEGAAHAGIAQPRHSVVGHKTVERCVDSIMPCALIINTLADVSCELLLKLVCISFYCLVIRLISLLLNP